MVKKSSNYYKVLHGIGFANNKMKKKIIPTEKIFGRSKDEKIKMAVPQ